ncbi:MAG TPA: DUF222 domain-containing protein, partial [Propionicimonas sp.]|nr:DUF222 domain-containing protein [Propionicimonas sp.]
LAALRLRLLAEADRSGATDPEAPVSAADWLAVETQQTRPSTRADLNLARALENRPVLAAALASGRANHAQARVIVKALDLLPVSGEFALTVDQRVQAEAHLVSLAADHDAHALRLLGNRILEVVAPDLAERHLGRLLAAEETAAARRTLLELREDHDGTCHGRFRIPTLHGQMLRKMILALCSPTRPTHTDIDPDLPTPVKHGQALCQLLEAIPAKSLPQTGGCGATIVVTLTHQQLLADLHAAGVATLDTGAQISAAEARRLACGAGIIPVVLGGKSEVLDVGRTRRLHTRAQRVALAVRDQGCTTTGCDRPPAICHAHHDIAWADGGPTTLDNGRLLCGHHHRRIHDFRYRTTHHPDGRVSVHRRT